VRLLGRFEIELCQLPQICSTFKTLIGGQLNANKFYNRKHLFADLIVLQESRPSPFADHLKKFMNDIIKRFLKNRFGGETFCFANFLICIPFSDSLIASFHAVFTRYKDADPAVRDLEIEEKGSAVLEQQCEILKQHVIADEFSHARDVISCIEYLKADITKVVFVLSIDVQIKTIRLTSRTLRPVVVRATQQSGATLFLLVCKFCVLTFPEPPHVEVAKKTNQIKIYSYSSCFWSSQTNPVCHFKL